MPYNPKALVVLKNFGESPHRHLELVDKLNDQFGIGGLHGSAWYIDLSTGVHVPGHDTPGWDGWSPGNQLNEFMDGIYPPKADAFELPLPPPIIPPPPVVFKPKAGERIAAPRFIEPTPPPEEDNGFDYEEVGSDYKCLHCGHVLQTEGGMKSHVKKKHR